jgi:uncharacterized protein (TIGR00369 family)
MAMTLGEYLEGWRSGAVPPPPIVARLGIRLREAGGGSAVVEMAVGRELWNAMGTVHGGVFADLADVAMGVALATVAGEGESFTTAHLEVHYFAAVREGELEARATVVRRGATTGYAECELRDAEGRLVAKASSTCVFVTAS